MSSSLSSLFLIAQTEDPGLVPFLLILIPVLAILVVVIAGMWKTYEKAGQPGWACLIPIYSQYVQAQMAGRPGWWTILLIIPYISIIFLLIVWWDITKAFGRGIGTYLGLIFLPFIFWPILGFGSAQYQDTRMGSVGQVFD